MPRRLAVLFVVSALIGSIAAVSSARSPGEPVGPSVWTSPITSGATLNALAIPATADGMGLVDPATGIWYLRTVHGDPTAFYYGNPNDYPFMGDWNCDGVDTPGLYRQSDGYAYLRNSNSQGIADVKFYFGNPGDVPIAGDFDGDGCDTLSIYRPSQQRFYIINELGSGDTGLGAADYWFAFGNPGDKPFAGDFDGDGLDEVGLHRESNGLVYFEYQLIPNAGGGTADNQFIYGNPGDRFAAGDWNGDGAESPALFRPGNITVYQRFQNTQGNADKWYSWGEPDWLPVAGYFGTLGSRVTVNLAGGPPAGLRDAVESLYLQHATAPALPSGLRSTLAGLSSYHSGTYNGTASYAAAYGGQAGVAQIGGDTILLASDDGLEWRVVGAHLASEGRARWFGAAPRHVALLGADAQGGTNTLVNNADSVHLYSVDATRGVGAITGLHRDTWIAVPYADADGIEKVAITMRGRGPATTVSALELETGLDLEGYFHTGFGTGVQAGVPGFTDLVDAFRGIAGAFNVTVPYSLPALGVGLQDLDGAEALYLARDRNDVPYGLGNIGRTLTQGLLLKAAVAAVQAMGIDDLPKLLGIMDDFVTTNLSLDHVITLAASVYTLSPGQLPTPAEFTALGVSAYDDLADVGTLPNVLVRGCTAEVGGLFGIDLLVPNYATFNDLADGDLDTLPIYRPADGWGIPPTLPPMCAAWQAPWNGQLP